MKTILSLSTFMLASSISLHMGAQTKKVETSAHNVPVKNLYIDVHQLTLGKVKFEDVAAAHEKDLAVQGKYGVNFINYWVDEKAGVVMCLSEAADSTAIVKTHKEAHGLVPVEVLKVKQGQ